MGFIADKAARVSPSSTLAIDSKAKAMIAQGIDVVAFGAGEPDFDTPQHIKDAAVEAIMAGKTKYTPASGTVDLKQAVCRKFARDNGLSYAPENIVVSNGAKHSLMNIFNAICNPGDEVIIPAPFWVSYPEMVKMADGVPVALMTKEENDFKFTADELEAAITDKTRALVLNTPSNPTGMVYTKAELEAIAEVILRHDIYVISDEIYEHLAYGDFPTSIAALGEEIKEKTIIVNGVSKTYAMTGWRIGYTASNAALAKVMSNIQSHATSNPNSIAQAAAIAALDGPMDEMLKMKAAFNERRKYMMERIAKIDGVSCREPKGAFYVMMNISALKGRTLGGVKIESSDDFANAFLEKALVAVVPGSGFAADDYVRWSYATSMENIKKGLDRLEAFLKA
ncbi:MAG: pyridoxal phosphate-dependent aminotransferase [Clostridia bacterium]|nr:pyridoxal phosphate-dependent aminotransferase [Clostridia bacterium]